MSEKANQAAIVNKLHRGSYRTDDLRGADRQTRWALVDARERKWKV
jgi:hypothetical protein